MRKAVLSLGFSSQVYGDVDKILEVDQLLRQLDLVSMRYIQNCQGDNERVVVVEDITNKFRIEVLDDGACTMSEKYYEENHRD